MNSAKSAWHSFLALIAASHMLLNVLITIFLLVVSGTNYPGGAALSRLHRLEQSNANVSVHIANLAAQSGVSRFMEIHSSWSYSKDEAMNYTQAEIQKYTHLLVEAKNKQNTELWTTLQDNFDIVEFVDCFNNIGIQYNSLLPVRIKTKPCIGILKKRLQVVVTEPLDEKTLARVNIQKEITKSKRSKKEKEKTKADELKSIEIIPLETIVKDDGENAVPPSEPGQIFEHESSSQPEFLLDGEEEDGMVATVEDISLELNADPVEVAKEINFQELRNLALDQSNRKSRAATKLKIRKIIEQHYRSKGRHIENDSMELKTREPRTGMRQTVKSIIKQEKIKEMIEQIATMDLTRICDLEKTSTKDCLKQVIDKIDDETSKAK